MFDYAELSDLQLLEMAASGSRGAEEQLAERYMQLVRVCARPLFLVGGDSEDLIQEGTFGLVSAIRQYKPDCGASFRTFAELCIRKRLYSAVKSASCATLRQRKSRFWPAAPRSTKPSSLPFCVLTRA